SGKMARMHPEPFACSVASFIKELLYSKSPTTGFIWQIAIFITYPYRFWPKVVKIFGRCFSIRPDSGIFVANIPYDLYRMCVSSESKKRRVK
ncbi:MAG: hypothetical protein JJE15_11855, partial [Desulfobacteraceae bacterium]|nr:hypothetical protein [Desulfobacteraceae bacterium]